MGHQPCFRAAGRRGKTIGKGIIFMVRSIVGANWGDEGKGKITDVLAERSDVVVRFQGGATRGIPSSTTMASSPCICFRRAFSIRTLQHHRTGRGLDIEKLLAEYDSVVQRGVPRPKLYISDRAQVMLPYHVDFDRFEEERWARPGLAPPRAASHRSMATSTSRSAFRSARSMTRRFCASAFPAPWSRRM